MNITVIAFLVAILVFGLIVFLFVFARGKTRSVLNVEKFRTAWMTIEQQLQKGNESSYQLCILNADKLLDSALKQRGFNGETMGERMKTAQSSWHNANSVWTSHKLRNQIAHEEQVSISYDQARRALAGFKQALKDLGAI